MSNGVFDKTDEQKDEEKGYWSKVKDNFEKKAEDSDNSIVKTGFTVGKALGKGAKALASLSDERCKELFGTDGEDKIDCLARIHSYDFTYKPEVVDKLKDAGVGVDDKVHSGVIAQDLENNPAFKGVVIDEDNPTGYKALDIRALTMANTGAIGDLARRVEELEALLGRRG